MRCATEFRPCACRFTTDVPAVHGGKGENPTPGDMLAAAVASCMLSMFGLTGKKHGFDAEGISIAASCEEQGSSITALNLAVSLPREYTEEQRKALAAAAAHCPVGSAIAERVQKNISWHCC